MELNYKNIDQLNKEIYGWVKNKEVNQLEARVVAAKWFGFQDHRSQDPASGSKGFNEGYEIKIVINQVCSDHPYSNGGQIQVILDREKEEYIIQGSVASMW